MQNLQEDHRNLRHHRQQYCLTADFTVGIKELIETVWICCFRYCFILFFVLFDNIVHFITTEIEIELEFGAYINNTTVLSFCNYM